MNRKLALAVCLLVSTICTAEAKIPDTPAGRLWQQWLGIYNAGDTEKLTKFIAERFSEKMLGGRTPEAEARREMGVRERMGNFVAVKAESGSAHDLSLLVRTENGRAWFTVDWHADPANPERMADDQWKPAEPPEKETGSR